MQLLPQLAAMAQRLPKVLGFAIKFGITAGVLIVLLRSTNVSTVIATVGAVGPRAFCVAVGIITSLVLVVALRWLQILKLIGHPISFFDSCRIVYIGLFFNQCLPSGIGGDAVRVWATTRLGVPVRPAFVSIAADRLFALAAVSIFILGAMPVLLVGPASLIGGMLSAASVLGFAMLLVFDHGLEFIERAPIAARMRARPSFYRIVNVVRELSRTVLLVLWSKPEGLLVVATSLFNQLALGVVVFLIANSLDIGIGLGVTLKLFPLAMLLSMLPISLGGWGVREGAMVWLFGTAGVPIDAALAMSLTFGLATTAAGLIGGIFWLAEPRGTLRLRGTSISAGKS